MKYLKLLLSLTTLLVLVTGCQRGPTTPEVSFVDETLPKVEGIKTLSDMTEIGFEWVPTHDPRVEGYHIYRSNPTKPDAKLSRVATIDEKYASHYVDTKLIPESEYFYRLVTYSKNDRESLPSDTVKIRTKPLLESVPFAQAIVGLPNRVKLLWRPHPYDRVASYIIERNELSSQKWRKVASIKGRLNAEYIDKDLKDNYLYRYRIFVKTHDGIISKPSKIVEARTKPLPMMIKGLSATNNLPKKIVLNWQASSEKDIQYYNVYSSPTSMLFYTYLAKTKDTKFEDLINSNGTDKYYKVTAVDKDGLESLRQENPVAGSTLSIPEPPVLDRVRHDGTRIVIEWEQVDLRAVKYDVIKTGEGKTDRIRGVDKTKFVDLAVMPGNSYEYQIIAIDKYGLESKPSKSAKIMLPKE